MLRARWRRRGAHRRRKAHVRTTSRRSARRSCAAPRARARSNACALRRKSSVPSSCSAKARRARWRRRSSARRLSRPSLATSSRPASALRVSRPGRSPRASRASRLPNAKVSCATQAAWGLAVGRARVFTDLTRIAPRPPVQPPARLINPATEPRAAAGRPWSFRRSASTAPVRPVRKRNAPPGCIARPSLPARTEPASPTRRWQNRASPVATTMAEAVRSSNAIRRWARAVTCWARPGGRANRSQKQASPARSSRSVRSTRSASGRPTPARAPSQ